MSDETNRPKTSSQQPTQQFTIDNLSLHAGDEEPGQAGTANVVMQTWFQLFRTAQIHAVDNQALQRPIAAMVDMTNTLIPKEGRLSFQAKDKALFVNGTKLRLSSDEYELAREIFQFFEERGIGGFTIEAPMNTAAVRGLLNALVYTPERKFDKLEAAVKAANLPFRLNKPLGSGKKSRAEVTLERRSYTFFTYSKLVVLYRSLIAEQKPVAAQRAFLVKKIARTIQALVDICLEDDHTFLGVSAVKSGEAYAAHHAANVAILAIALGEKLGFSKVELADLGMGAVFHDVGLRDCPADLLMKPEPLDQKDRTWIEQHPMRSVEYLLNQRSFSKSSLSQMVVAFEHHRNFDGSGYPFGSRRPDIFSRIVTIADVYDAMTTQRPWRNAFMPDETLGMMSREAGRRFDPALMKVYVNTLGLYPVGTLVRLDTGDLGVVIYGGGEGERLSRPIITLLNREGKPSGTVDLAERTPAGAYRWSIVMTEDPKKFGIQPSGLIAISAGVGD
ncbi:MAG TPA: HD domain-containing phosphohydrolase [Thermoanaerobaculia bacterium]